MDRISSEMEREEKRKILTEKLKNTVERENYISNEDITIDCLEIDNDGYSSESLGHYKCRIKDCDSAEITLQISNNTLDEVIIKAVYQLSEDPKIEFSDISNGVKQNRDIRMPEGGKYNIVVKCYMKEPAYLACDVIIEFEIHCDETKDVTMARVLEFSKTNDLIEKMGSGDLMTGPYRRKHFIPPFKLGFNYDRSSDRPICVGNNLKRVLKIQQYRVPKGIKNFVENEYKNENQPSPIRVLLEKKLTKENYTKKFSNLIWVEEVQIVKEVSKYGKQNKKLEKLTKRFKLKLKNLAERRPSVLRGDQIFVRAYTEGENPKEYQGFVHEENQDHLIIGFSAKFIKQYKPDMRFAIRFSMSRFPFRGKQRSISPFLTDHYPHLLFPEDDNSSHVSRDLDTFYNKNINNNAEQYKAVKSIVFGQSKVPYIIYGPPGTGKTSTLVEAVLQVLKTQPNAHILVCAPSNNATDLIMQRMLEYDPDCDVFRLCAWTRPFRHWFKDKPKNFMGKTNYNYSDHDYYFPSKSNLMGIQVLATTVTLAGRLASAGFPNDHFDFVFADEAGNAQEPEIMTAVAGVLSKTGRLILAGDPKQLGPVIISTIALKYGLGKSYMERIMETQTIYKPNPAIEDKQEYDERFLTKLLNNYRSHEAIIKIPNQFFYDNELQACLDEKLRYSLCEWQELPKKGFPVIFHGVKGQNEQEKNSPSYFNKFEINQVIQYVNKLLKERGNGVTPKEIGIITPYSKQVKKIQQYLYPSISDKQKEEDDEMEQIDSSKLNNPEHIRVGTVEAFQGDERRVIIISTVRSNTQHYKIDKKFNLGFLVNEKRFNVAVTRAALLLIVIGDPDVLNYNQHWRAFIQFCIDNGGYRGDPPKPISNDAIIALNKGLQPVLEDEDKILEDEMKALELEEKLKKSKFLKQ